MNTIYVTKRDGTKQPFDADKINKSIERACAGLPEWLSKVTQIATETSLTLYDGITEDELDQATINAALQNVQQDPDYGIVATRLFLKTVYKNILGEFDRDNPNAVQKLHEDTFEAHIKDAVTRGILREEMVSRFDLTKLAQALRVERDNLFTYAGASTLMHRYTLKKDGENSYETPQFAFMRIAMGLTFIEENATDRAIELYESMSQLDYVAGGSANIGSGTKNAALSNCFLIQMEDDMAHIAKTVSDVMMISKATGGLGVSVTKLRATGSPLSHGGASSGPTTFAKIMDVAIRSIVRGGKKKGALCFYMEPWHMDFPEFIDWKHNAGDEHERMRTANTAGFLNDEFMRRALADQEWYMFDPKETPDLVELYGDAFAKRYAEYIELAKAGKMRLHKVESASKIWKKMLVALVSTSHPWITWKDAFNVRAINNNTGTIHMSNLCTEIALPQDKDNIAVCNLGSLNLATHLKGKEMDWQKLEKTVRTSIRSLDNLLDINILPVEEARNSDQNNRAVGMGVMGVADTIEKMGWAYESEETYKFIDQVFEFISYIAIDTSADLAQERGSYKNFEGSRWSKGMVPYDTLAELNKVRGGTLTLDMGMHHGGLDWDALRAKVKKGMRNATLMAVAPNANIGLVAGTVPGMDSRFAQVFARSKFSGKYLDINTNLVDELKALGLWEKTRNQIIETHGDIQTIETIPADVRNRYKSSFEISPIAVIEITARAQKWIDQAISRNMYLETRENNELSDIYGAAWNKGLKSTYYAHVKPRHSAEQSTTTVNKRESQGRKGFAALGGMETVSPVAIEEVVASKPKISFAMADGGLSESLPEDPALRNQCDSCQ
jgi:ribonucleoside-diphosphate reductase alpha chain